MPSLVVLVLFDLSHFEELLAAWRGAGASAVTMLDSLGTRELEERAAKDDLPIMPTIRDLLQGDEAPRKTVFSVVEDEAVEPIIEVTEEIIGDLSEPHRGILFVVPVSRVVGMRTE
jgi:nitrogen regulatory protein PII